MKAILATILSAILAIGVSAQNIHNEYGNAENFSDIVLIYAGNVNRNTWNEAQLTPYVTHTYSDGTEKWLFDSFLFLEFARTRTVDGVNITFGFGNGMGGDKPATQEDWKWILDEYFAIGPSYATTKLAALDNLIGKKIGTLGKPQFRHKVVIVCPAPKKDGTVWSSEPWGEIDGHTISLSAEANRLKAVKWYIDELIDRWNKAGYKNIDLDGIYWIEEGMISNAGIIADVNDYARSKGLRTYWIPYYRSGNEPYCRKWQSDFKFDMCYFQPNYAFYQSDGSTLPKSQLENTCRAAKKYGAGLDLEFETSGSSNALHSVDAAAHQRINDYMDVFTDEGVFDEGGVAYYVGSRGLNHMKSSTDPVDHATIDRMASIVSARQQAKYGNTAALDSIQNEDGGKGAVVTRDAAGVTFTQDTADGKLSYTFKKCMANDLFTFYQVTLDGATVNTAQYSDNIGPFLVVDKGWIGGNHLSDTGNKSAKTIDYEIRVDGEAMDIGTRPGNEMEVNVTNELYLPDGSIFAIEKVKYLVAGNSIEVWASHDYKIASEVTIDRYYGMQSMFVGENEILAPGAKKYNKWLTFTPGGADNAIKIKNYDAPGFSVFIEKSPNAYQAAYMVREDLGKRSKLGVEDVTYIGNSYEKSYHKLMGMCKVKPDETTKWHGVYSWFKEPKTDTFRAMSDNPVFEYTAYISGNPVILSVDSKGTVAQTPQAAAEDALVESRGDADAEYYNLYGVRLSSPQSGRICLKHCCGETTKVCMK